jgi:hypothetical protein
MIGLLARRTLTDRPRRSLLLLLGFGIAVGVMIVLLSIGEAVLDQARDANVMGGGDVIVLPEGVDVEVMKVGGATGMFFRIDNARYVFRQLLSGPRLAPRLASVPAPVWPGEAAAPPLAAASPALAGKLVYVRPHAPAGRTPSPPRRALAHGVIPSLERAASGPPRRSDGSPVVWADSDADRMWMDPPADSLYNDMDRFHQPAAGQQDLERWAEWLYFNFTDSATGAYGFLSYIVSGDVGAGHGRASPTLQLAWPDRAPQRFAGDVPLAASDISTTQVALAFGSRTSARFRDGAWRLQLGWESPAGPVRGELAVRPVADLYQPPVLLHASERFVSGYVVPAIRATLSGWIEAGGRRLELRDAPAYHDHNWGTWRNVHWDWGTASSAQYGLLYGRVAHPESQPGRTGAGIFLLLTQARQAGARGGLWGLFRPDSLAYSWGPADPELPGEPQRVPHRISIATARAEPAAGDAIEVAVRITDALASAPRPGEAPRVFLQMRGEFRVRAQAGGREVAFTAPGFAETFVPAGPKAPRPVP